MLEIINLKIENLAVGCVTDNPHPKFSFALKSDKENTSFFKAVIEVGGWSKTVYTEIGNSYDGPPLRPYTEYELTVTATDNHGRQAQGRAVFETGRLGGAWEADWITDATYVFKARKASPLPMTFRKTINLRKRVRSAKLYVTAVGIYEFEINGRKVGGDYFAPGFTSYKNQLQYQVYDVTSMLTGTDTLSAVVAGGWAVGKFTHCLRNRIFAKRQALLCELKIDYEGGGTETVCSDRTWKVTTDGAFKEADFYDGESFDASSEPESAVWKNAACEKLRIKPRLVAAYGAPVRRQEVMRPVKSFRSKSGMLVYDFGQNFAGVVNAEIRGKKGQRVIFKHAEIMLDGELFTKPLRTAKATATYICAGRGIENYSPRLTYMGFRYVGVTGVEEADLRLSAYALYSDMEQAGAFECSDELINKLQSNIVWSAKSNFIDIPTDCPQRDERMGWTGDIALFAPTAAFNFDTSRFLGKWLTDLRTDQKKSGGVPVTIPHVVFPSNLESVFTMAIDHWGDSCILVPWSEYVSGGDIEILKKSYPSMKRYLKACKFWAGLLSLGKRRRIWRLGHHYGDWCAPGLGLFGWMRRGRWTATACWANSCRIVSEIADLLGNEKDKAYYLKLYGEISTAYRDVFTDKRGKMKKEFQTAYVLPLYYRLFKDGEKKAAAGNLARLIKDNNYHIGTGFPGTPYVLFALADNGYAADAFKMLKTDTCPSWLFEVRAGGTTIWERWDALRGDGTSNTGADDGTKGMVSFNHYASGAVGDFLYRRIAGLEAVTGGYKTFKIKPLIGGGLTRAGAWHMTPYGKAASGWEIDNGRVTVTAEVPVSCTCELTMPDGEVRTLGSGSYMFSCDL